MAAVASSDVTLVRQHEGGDRFGRLIERVKTYDVVFSANGGTANDVPASLFGLTTIYWVEVIRAVDGSSALSWVAAVVETDGEGLLLCDPEVATDAARGNPTNYTGTVRLRVAGM